MCFKMLSNKPELFYLTSFLKLLTQHTKYCSFIYLAYRLMSRMAFGPGWSFRAGLEGLNIMWDLAPPCSASLVGVTGALSICHCGIIMAAWLSRSLKQKNASWLQPCPTAIAQVWFSGMGRASSASGALSVFQDKPRTVEDLPRVTFLEMIYRMVFQGFYNRIHELQVGQAAVHCSAWSLDVTDLHVHQVSVTVMHPCFNLHPKILDVLMHSRNFCIGSPVWSFIAGNGICLASDVLTAFSPSDNA